MRELIGWLQHESGQVGQNLSRATFIERVEASSAAAAARLRQWVAGAKAAAGTLLTRGFSDCTSAYRAFAASDDGMRRGKPALEPWQRFRSICERLQADQMKGQTGSVTSTQVMVAETAAQWQELWRAIAVDGGRDPSGRGMGLQKPDFERAFAAHSLHG